MTDAELSRDLAMALGWKYVYPNSPATKKYWKHEYAAVSEGPGPRGTMLVWRRFDYTAPSVVVPLIKWLTQPHGGFRCWPNEESWTVLVSRRDIEERNIQVQADTLEAAVAKAVIAVKGGE